MNTAIAESREPTGTVVVLPPRGRGRPKGSVTITHTLTTATSVRREMARVYRLCREGEIEPDSLARLIYALREIGVVIEKADLEKQIAELRDRIEGLHGKRRGGRPPSTSSSRYIASGDAE